MMLELFKKKCYQGKITKKCYKIIKKSKTYVWLEDIFTHERLPAGYLIEYFKEDFRKMKGGFYEGSNTHLHLS